MSHDLYSAEELSLVLDSMREGLQVIDHDWRYVYLNAAASQHGRRERKELVGRTMFECYPGIESTELFRWMKRCMDERISASQRNAFEYPDGRQATFELRVAPCHRGITVLSIDVTERAQLESQLRHAQKMEAVGRLSGSVAHDYNNLLSVILSYSALLLSDQQLPEASRADIEAIHQAGLRAAELTRHLLTFSRRQADSPRVLELNRQVLSQVPALERLLGEDIELTTSAADSPLRILIDPGQLDQVLMNLVINARDAMPNGGRITIETNSVWLDETFASQHLDVTPGPYIALVVSDTGVGMSEEVQSRIFDPFFTTKDSDKGTGLGLSIVFGIVKQAQGSVWVYSEPDKGTTFKLYFPRQDADELPVSEPEAPITLRGNETLLLVEDQPQVRRVAADILQRFGYRVLVADNAGEALLLHERHGESIRLLLTDVVMPHVGGRELAERLKRSHPTLQVLFMSGYGDRAIMNHGILEPNIQHLQKPFTPHALASKVREVLDASSK